MKAPSIPTKYNGRMFRSRLEARWACFFNLLEWKWEYEPVDLYGWIPDFSLTGPCGTTHLVEVKPIFDYDLPTGIKIANAVKNTAWAIDYVDMNNMDRPSPDVILVGAALPVSAFGLGTPPGYNSALGWIVDRESGGQMSGVAAFSMGKKTLSSKEASAFDFFDDTMCFHHRLDGQYDGDHHLCMPPPYAVDDMWKEAGNEVQWKAPERRR